MVIFKGVFWIKSLSPIEAVVIKSECDDVPEKKFCSKSGKNYNHKAAWSTLDKTVTSGYPYNYYPRGRVEIRNGKAFVFANSNIVNDEFNLKELNQTKIIADMSNHYLCHIDRD